MEPKEIGEKYDMLAHIWQEPHIQSNGILQFKRAIQFSKNRGAALDVGCGCSGRFIDLLAAEGFAPEGIDISAKMIELARIRHPSITFYNEDICTWDFPRKYDFIAAWDSIFHLPLESQEPVMQKICENLTKEGICILTAGGVDRPGEKSDSAMGPEISYSSVGIPKLLSLLTKFGCVCRHFEYDQFPENHVYVIAQRS